MTFRLSTRIMNNKFMQRAIQIALENVKDVKGGPFGTVIVKNNKIIAEGTNQVTNNNDPTAHAEIIAIRNACNKLNDFNLSGCEIYTSCEPCPMCLSAIYWARISEIYFACAHTDASEAGFDDSFIYQELKKQFSDRHIPMTQLMEVEAKQIFDEWNKSENKILY